MCGCLRERTCSSARDHEHETQGVSSRTSPVGFAGTALWRRRGRAYAAAANVLLVVLPYVKMPSASAQASFAIDTTKAPWTDFANARDLRQKTRGKSATALPPASLHNLSSIFCSQRAPCGRQQRIWQVAAAALAAQRVEGCGLPVHRKLRSRPWVSAFGEGEVARTTTRKAGPKGETAMVVEWRLGLLWGCRRTTHGDCSGCTSCSGFSRCSGCSGYSGARVTHMRCPLSAWRIGTLVCFHPQRTPPARRLGHASATVLCWSLARHSLCVVSRETYLCVCCCYTKFMASVSIF